MDTTQYILLLNGTALNVFATLAAAQTAATAHGPGTYVIETTLTSTSITATVNYVVPPVVTFTESPNDTVVLLGSTAAITDAVGNKWTLTAAGSVAVNGVVDTTTIHVLQLAYVSKVVWQESNNLGGVNLWWGKTSPTAAWLPGPGTATSPLPTSGGGGGTGTVARPAGNTGVGFFVAGGKLYDANSHQFIIRGVNKNFDDGAQGYGISGANAVRYMLYGTDSTAHVTAQLASYVAFKMVPIYTMYTFPNGTKSTGNTDPAQLVNGVAYWATLAPQLKPYERYMILNIANEWGPQASTSNTVWRDAYIASIKTLRAAGINCALMVDAAGYGQDLTSIFLHAAAVFASDPQHNTVFSYHAYGSATALQSPVASIAKGATTTVTLNSTAAIHPLAPGFNGTNNSWTPVTAVQIVGVTGMTQINGVFPIASNVGGTPGAWTVNVLVNSTAFSTYASGGTIYDQGNYASSIPRLAALQPQGLCTLVGEFGPGRNIGPSPTLITPDQIVSTCEASGIGWMPWAWDNNNLNSGNSDDNGFCMTTSGPGIYTGTPSQLTTYGKDMVAWYAKVAKRATVF